MNPPEITLPEGSHYHVDRNDDAIACDIPFSGICPRGFRFVHVMDDVYVARDIVQMRKAHPGLPDDPLAGAAQKRAIGVISPGNPS